MGAVVPLPYIYLLRWGNLGKVGKTRSIPNRKQFLIQRFKEAEILWYCQCHQVDFVEREILQKLEQLGAVGKQEGSVEVFDPQVISFLEVQEEIQRLVEKIDRNGPFAPQYTTETDRILLKQQYTELANSVVQYLGTLSPKVENESIQLLKQVFVNFVDL
jgi:hypothetical protein